MGKTFEVSFMYAGGFKLFDLIIVGSSRDKNGCCLVVKCINRCGIYQLTCLPYAPSKYRIINKVRYLIIRIKLFLKLI